MKDDVVFLTGASGFLGTQIVRRLIKKNLIIIVLVRGQSNEDAIRHLNRSWWEWPELIEKIEALQKVMNGDYDQR